MLRKLLAMIVVLTIAAAMAVPAFAQTLPDLSLEWGSEEWLINQFGDEYGDVTLFCETAGQSADTIAAWGAAFPNLYDLCGWSVEEAEE